MASTESVPFHVVVLAMTVLSTYVSGTGDSAVTEDTRGPSLGAASNVAESTMSSAVCGGTDPGGGRSDSLSGEVED